MNKSVHDTLYNKRRCEELVPSANTKREMVQSLSAELGRGYFVASGVQTIMTGSLTCLCTVVSTLPS
jgi:hypothetical protein